MLSTLTKFKKVGRKSLLAFSLLLSCNVLLLQMVNCQEINAGSMNLTEDAMNTNVNSTRNVSIKNFAKVDNQIWRGAKPSKEQIHELKNLGIKTIVSLRMPGRSSQAEARLAKSLGMEYIHVPLGYRSPNASKIEKVMQVLTDADRLPIYLHCRHGADRTGMTVGIYRVLVNRWQFEQAYDEMRQHHFKPWFLSMKNYVRDCGDNSSLRRFLAMQKQEPDSAGTGNKVLVGGKPKPGAL